MTTHACAAVAGLILLTCSLTGCGALGPPASSAASVTVTPTAVRQTVTGTWVFADRYTREELRLRQAKNGAVSGSGRSAVIAQGGKVDRSSIDVNRGTVRAGRLTLSLYVTQVNWGSGMAVVENVRCAVAPRVLHCRMDLPLYRNVRNVPQEFHRR